MTLKATALQFTRSMARRGMQALLGGSARHHSSRDDNRTSPSKPKPKADSTPRASRPRASRPPQNGTSHHVLDDWQAPLPTTSYAPRPDGRPDPGEVVWAWVAYEEDRTQGKDRPVLIVARHPQCDDVVLALPLTSKDHDRDEAQEARAGRHWMDVGSGAWDSRHRPSEVRLDRVLQLDVTTVRREGAVLDEATFDAVVRAARAF